MRVPLRLSLLSLLPLSLPSPSSVSLPAPQPVRARASDGDAGHDGAADGQCVFTAYLLSLLGTYAVNVGSARCPDPWARVNGG